MTERDIQFAIYNHRRYIRAFPMILTNIYFFPWESDALYITPSGVIHDFEIKISHSDFLADLRKGRLEWMQQHSDKGPQFFWYVCPPEIIKPEEVPECAGLFYVVDRSRNEYYQKGLVPSHRLTLREIRKAPKRKGVKLQEHQWPILAGKAIDRFWSVREMVIDRDERKRVSA